MKPTPTFSTLLCVLALSLTGCVMSSVQPGPRAHLTPTQCSDLTALRHHEPLTRERNASEIAALREAGYDPSPLFDDPYYPDDLQAAQRLVDYWYQTECQPTQSN